MSDGGPGGDDGCLPAAHDPLHLLEGPIQEPIGAVIVAALDDLCGIHAGAINLPFGKVARLHHIGQHLVLTNMVEAGYLTQGQVYGARMNPAKIVERSDYYSPDWFLDWAFEEVQRIMRGRKEHIVAARTTVDIGLQKMAEQSIQQTIAQYGRGRSFQPGRHGRDGE